VIFSARFEVFLAMKMEFVVFWVVAPCGASVLKAEAAQSFKIVSSHHT
jgi:hypothetical protein